MCERDREGMGGTDWSYDGMTLCVSSPWASNQAWGDEGLVSYLESVQQMSLIGLLVFLLVLDHIELSNSRSGSTLISWTPAVT